MADKGRRLRRPDTRRRHTHKRKGVMLGGKERDNGRTDKEDVEKRRERKTTKKT